MIKSELLKIAIQAAIEAGKVIISIYQSDSFDTEMKSDNSPLTKADKEANEVIKKHLQETKIPILSEEGKLVEYSERMNWVRFWMVDPLDGTKEFVKRNGEFTVNIALIENGVPVLGVVYCPVKKWLYYADKENGSYKETIENGKVITEKLPKVFYKEKYVVVGSRSHSSPETEAFIEKLKNNTNKEIEFVSMGSSLKICLVAEGSADIYPRLAPTMEWDTAAAHAIALYSGFQITDFQSKNPLKYNKENLLNPHFIVSV